MSKESYEYALKELLCKYGDKQRVHKTKSRKTEYMIQESIIAKAKPIGSSNWRKARSKPPVKQKSSDKITVR